MCGSTWSTYLTWSTLNLHCTLKLLLYLRKIWDAASLLRPKIFCTHYWISFKNSLNHKLLITIYSTTFHSRFQGLVWDLQVRFWKTESYGTVHKNLIFNTTKISHHFGHVNKSQKNTVSPCWMKLLVVQVGKSKLSDLPKFCSQLLP